MCFLSVVSFLVLFLSCLNALKLKNSNIYTIDLGYNTESVAYDSENGWWLIAEGSQTDTGISGNKIRAWAPTGSDDPTGGSYGPIYYPTPMGNETQIDLSLPAGMYRDNDNNILYIANLWNGYIVGIDTDTNVTMYSLDTNGANPNGMCYNSANNMLYVTDTAALTSDGNQQIWELHMNLTVSRLLLSSDDDVYPNGCIVVDDTLYVVQFYGFDDQDIIDNLGVIYWEDISSSSPRKRRAGAPHGLTSVDAIVMDDGGNLWINDWNGDGTDTTGSLWYLAAEDINSNATEWTQVTGEVLQSPANMAFDPVNGWILCPSFLGQKLYVINPVLTSTAFSLNATPIIVALLASLVALIF